MTRSLRAFLVAWISTVSIAAFPAGSARADVDIYVGSRPTSSDQGTPNTTPYWSNNSRISAGNCGVSVGSTVVGIQTVLAAAQLLRKGVDGVAGADTDFAIRVWQAEHDLVVDGCAGAVTWNEMQEIPHSYNRAAHPNLVYRVCNPDCKPAHFDRSRSFGLNSCVYSAAPGIGGYNTGRVTDTDYYVMLTSGTAFRTFNPSGHPSCDPPF